MILVPRFSTPTFVRKCGLQRLQKQNGLFTSSNRLQSENANDDQQTLPKRNGGLKKDPNPWKDIDVGKERIKLTATRKSWLDSMRIHCKAGSGGNGYPISGGVGGRGGDCIVESVKSRDETKKYRSKKALRTAKSNYPANLFEVHKYQFKGETANQRITGKSGGHSTKQQAIGEAGEDGIIRVPAGVVIEDDNGKQLYSLDEPDTRVIVASGGVGGGKDTDWFGTRGQNHFIRLQLKLVADLGLVGFPNAGKSTFLKAVSNARPKIASYPFTTLRPNIGHVKFKDERDITIADLPGLIEGAHYNIGMGHKFLRHVERTSILCFVVDISGFQLNRNSPNRSAFETVALLNRELELYDPQMLEKPALCLVNKMDTENASERFDDLLTSLNENYEDNLQILEEELRPRRKIEFDEIIPMSAKFSQSSIIDVKSRLRNWLDKVGSGASREGEEESTTDENHLLTTSKDERKKLILERIRERNEETGPKLV